MSYNMMWLRKNRRTFTRRKMGVHLVDEPGDQEATSASVRAPTVTLDNLQAEFVPVPPPMIDVDATDDDVIELSASEFAEAKRKSTRARNINRVQGGATRLPANVSNKRRRLPFNQHVIDCERVSINVDEVNKPLRVSRSKAPPPPPPPPEKPEFTCPICISPFTKEVSTKCGHIFCLECIKKTISNNGTCPTCRKKITLKELIRVFLPAIK